MRIRLPIALILTFALALLTLPALGQDPVPTLTPPTLVPTVESSLIDALNTESTIARITANSVVRVGTLYNEPPFAELNFRGEVSGFDADLVRAMAEAWGVTAEFVQVTRQTGIDMLANGNVDLLVAAQPDLRELDARVEFSQPYYPSVQALLVRESDPAQTLAEMADRRVGYVQGTRSEYAVNYWLSRAEYRVQPIAYVTLDQALIALYNNEIDGVVENLVRLRRVVTQLGVARSLEEPVMHEPFAVGVRRQDVNLRNLVDRTLQFFLTNGRLNEIHQVHFNNVDYPAENALIAWANVGEAAPTPSLYGGALPYPTQYVVPRLQGERVLRVAGIRDVSPDAGESVRRLDAVHRALVNEMARRWGVTVVYVPESGSPLEQVAAGQADLAVGMTPDWNAAATVDFSHYYMLHGLQLMYEANTPISGVADLRSRAIGLFTDEPDSRDVLLARAEAVRARIDDIYPVANENDAAFAILAAEDINLFAVFGDSMKLVPHLENNPETLALVEDADGRGFFYSRNYLAMATPRNDLDFRLLVNYTLEEMAREGTLQTLVQPILRPQDAPPFAILPGPDNYLGFNLR